ncbi:MAG: methyltransferase type 12 [Panacagrimonas sp.]
MNPTDFQAILDTTHCRIHAGEVTDATIDLVGTLRHLRLTNDEDYWQQVVRPACEQHPLRDVFLQDPLTRRTREKPRGYAGDAVMLDQLYFRVPPSPLTPIGAQVFAYTSGSPAGDGVLWRMKMLAREIDHAAARFGSARVLSPACGHLREAAESKALAEGMVEKLFAVDQDVESLDVASRDYGQLPIDVQAGSVRGVLNGDVRFDALHLAYAAGLYDYLAEPIAQALTARLFGMLAPGGKLIVPNFLTTNHARGYMETFMDWHLIVRDRVQIERLGHGVPRDEIASSRYFEDPFGVVGYLELVRSG